MVVRGQLYVDDPAVCARGPPAEVAKSFDLLLAWWLALGLPLAWKKGYPEKYGLQGGLVLSF